MSDESVARIELGYVSKAHGLTGEVEVKLNWAQSRSLAELDEVLVTPRNQPPRSCRVEQVRRTPKGFLLKLEGVEGRIAAEALRGAIVGAYREALPSLDEGEYYLRDLVGAEVVAPDGTVGQIVRVHVYPSVDSAEVELPGGERRELPLLDQWIESVDVESAVVRITDREALIESQQSKKVD